MLHAAGLPRLRAQLSSTLGGMKRFRAFHEPGPRSFSLYSTQSEEHARASGLLAPDAQLAWEIEAETWEEAMAIHHLRAGFEPYVPAGAPFACPSCGAWTYPAGSGECWKCGSRS